MLSRQTTTGETPTANEWRVRDKSALRKQADRVLRKRLAGGREWLDTRVQGRVSEVAVGTGRNLAYYPAGVTVTGIELSRAMLETARVRVCGD